MPILQQPGKPSWELSAHRTLAVFPMRPVCSELLPPRCPLVALSVRQKGAKSGMVCPMTITVLTARLPVYQYPARGWLTAVMWGPRVGVPGRKEACWSWENESVSWGE